VVSDNEGASLESRVVVLLEVLGLLLLALGAGLTVAALLIPGFPLGAGFGSITSGAVVLIGAAVGDRPGKTKT
jgi:hypothetical protein